MLHCLQKQTDIAKKSDNICHGSTSAAVLFYEDFSFSAQTPTVPCKPKYGRPDMSPSVHSRECAKATALFVSSFGSSLKFENMVPGASCSFYSGKIHIKCVGHPVSHIGYTSFARSLGCFVRPILRNRRHVRS